MKEKNFNGYELTRVWFDWAFEKKEAKVIHTALYLWIVELNNKLAWKKEFGLPTTATMEGLSIGNKNTYLSTLRDLKTWGFIEIISESKNQYQACIISLCYVKSDTALIQHCIRHCNGTIHGTDTIDKQDKLLNNKTNKHIDASNFDSLGKLHVTPKEKACKFLPPGIEEVIVFFDEKGYSEESAKKAFYYYESANWKDRNNMQVKNWKQKMIGVWFKDENLKTNKPKTYVLDPLNVW